jgi:hypothetical protein
LLAGVLAFVGLNRPFCLEDMLPEILSSRFPGGQGALIRVPSCSLCRNASPPHCRSASPPLSCLPSSGFLAAMHRLHCSPFRDSTSSSCLPSRSGISILDFTPGLALRWRFVPTPYLAICPRAPTPRVSRWWLFQPHQRTRCRRCLRLVQVRRP